MFNFIKKKDYQFIYLYNFSVEWTDANLKEKGIIEFYQCNNTKLRKISVIGKFMYNAEKKHLAVLSAKSWINTGFFMGQKLGV